MDLHLDLDDAPGRSLRARAEHALREAVRSGRLVPGTRLPPTRALAAQLGVSRGVVVEAYAQLAAEGYLRTRRGGGTTVAGGGARTIQGLPAEGPHASTGGAATGAHGGRSAHGAAGAASGARGGGPACAVAPTPPGPAGPARHGLAAAPRYDLRPNLPAVDGFPRTAWLAALGRVLRTVPDHRLGYPEPFGEPELRVALAAWLARRRGVRAEPDRVVVTGGLRHGLPLAWGLLAGRGVRRVAVERPGWRRIPDTLRAAGLEPVPVRVDRDGLDPATLPGADVRAVAVTPAHHFPTGAVLGPDRRSALVTWAREHDAFLLEDDYDAEYRYDRHPVGSLQGLAPDRVIHGGSTSKVLAPALRLGWLVLPSMLTTGLDPERGPSAGTPPPLDQLALADLLERGDVDRHLRRQRARYRRRREALLDAVAAQLPEVEVRGAAAGLFAVLVLPPGLPEDDVVAAAAARGVALEGVGGGGPAGLATGYANLPEAAAPAAVAALAQAIGDTVRAPTTARRRPA
jgi:GntR family transcriptional regulator/MocR family aminotransferase